MLDGQERAGENHGHEDQPRRGAHGDRVRQRRRRPGRAALTAGLAHGRARRPGGLAIVRGHRLDVFAHRMTPPSGISPWARSQSAATRRGSCPASLDLRVEGAQRVGGKPRGHRVEHGQQARAEAGDRLAAHHGRDVLGRLQGAVIGQHHQMPCRDVRVGREEQRDRDVPGTQGLERQRPPGVEGDERLEAQAVGSLQAAQAIGALGALRRPAEHQPRRHRGEVPDRPQAVARRRRRRHHDGVGVLRGGRAGGQQAPAGQRAGQSPVGGLDVGCRRAMPEADELQRRPGVLRNNLQQAVHQGRLDQLAGAQIRHDPDREAARRERLPVDLGEQDALGKIERPDRDDRAVPGGLVGGRGRDVAAGGRAGRQDDRQPDADRPEHRAWCHTYSRRCSTRQHSQPGATGSQ